MTRERVDLLNSGSESRSNAYGPQKRTIHTDQMSDQVFPLTANYHSTQQKGRGPAARFKVNPMGADMQ